MNKGFTLIELMVVTVIVAIMVLVSIQLYQEYKSEVETEKTLTIINGKMEITEKQKPIINTDTSKYEKLIDSMYNSPLIIEDEKTVNDALKSQVDNWAKGDW